MIFIGHTVPKMLIAESGKKLRSINDVYEPSHIDDDGNEVAEVIPTYSDFVFLASGIDSIEDAQKIYVEEMEK